eukprot:XP_003726452.1 PREDICTED: echinoidin-like [Strongylocentrotus purpuratus]
MALRRLGEEILLIIFIFLVARVVAGNLRSEQCQIKCGSIALDNGDIIALEPRAKATADIPWLQEEDDDAAMTTPSAGSCAQSWFYFEGSCYGYFRDPVNFKSALKVCRTVENGTADLVSIHSEAENAFVYNLWLTEEEYLGQLLWIGYYQHEALDPFTWTDGTPEDYTSWEPTQPDNNGGNEDCVAFWRQSAANDADKPWNDVFCSSVTAPFVCKKAP